MKINRRTTNKINYILDNWMPPAVRDQRFLMGLAFRAVLGSKYKYYMTFKENACTMSQADINSYYELLADTFIKRKTDLNDGCIRFIFDHITGASVLDAGAGKGYLAHLLYQNRETLFCKEKPDRSEKADMRGGI